MQNALVLGLSMECVAGHLGVLQRILLVVRAEPAVGDKSPPPHTIYKYHPSQSHGPLASGRQERAVLPVSNQDHRALLNRAARGINSNQFGSALSLLGVRRNRACCSSETCYTLPEGSAWVCVWGGFRPRGI